MSKMKVGEITIENGKISFSQQSSSQTIQTSTTTTTTIPHENSFAHPVAQQSTDAPSTDELLDKLPSNKVVLYGGGLSLLGIGALLLANPFSLPLFVSLAGVPLVSVGGGACVLGLMKGQRQKTKAKIQAKEDGKVKEENQDKLLAFFRGNERQWKFEELEKENILETEALLITLKILVDENRIIEDMDTSTGEWFYIINKEHKKESTQPQTLEDRLKNMRS